LVLVVPIIRWHGHACFEVIDSKGFSIVIDPHDGGSIGIRPPNTKADAVLITHDHFDHNAYHVVLKSGGVVHDMRLGEFEVAGHRVMGVKAFHDKSRGRRRGEVVMYRLNVDGVNILHVGDLGHIPPDDELSKLMPVDVLMVPVGGTFTIDSREAVELAEKLDAKVVIPMHYWIHGINLPLAPLSDFLKLITWKVIELGGNEWRIERYEIPAERTVVIFKLA